MTDAINVPYSGSTGGVSAAGQVSSQGMDPTQEALGNFLVKNGNQLKNIKSWKEFSALLNAQQPQDKQLSDKVYSQLFGAFSSVSPAGTDAQFDKAFVAFLGTYQPPQSTDPKENLDAFTTQYQDFLGLGKDPVSMDDYNKTFTEAFGTSQTEDLQKELDQFTQTQVDEKGFFIPKQSYSDWDKMIKSLNTADNIPADQFSGVMGMIMLLIESTQLLQKLVVVQTKTVERSVNQQKNMNTIIGQLGMVTRDDSQGYLGRADAKDKKDASDLRADLNSKAQNSIQGWQQQRDMMQSDTKGIEQFLQTLNTMISQRFDICTSLIQAQNQIATRIF